MSFDDSKESSSLSDDEKKIASLKMRIVNKKLAEATTFPARVSEKSESEDSSSKDERGKSEQIPDSKHRKRSDDSA